MLSPGSITNSVPDPDEAIRLQRDIQRTAQENASARSLQQSQIGAGGLLINGGGSLTIAGTGSLNVGSGSLNSAGSISAATDMTAGGTVTGATVNSTGAVTAGGTATIGGLLTANAGVSSTDAKTRVLTSGWSSLWVDTSGRFGQSPSARRFKQDIAPAEIDVDGVLTLTPVHYRLKAAVEEFGDDAPVEVGLIAEDVEPVAPWAVCYDAEGQIQGINYDRLTVVLLELAKAQQVQVDGVEARLAALEALT